MIGATLQQPEKVRKQSGGFVLVLTIVLIMGVTAISVGTMFTGKMGRMSSINYKKKIQTFTASDGMVTLLSQEIINGNGSKYVDASRTGRIVGQVWDNIAGTDVNAFRTLTRNDPVPDRVISSYYLGSHLNRDNYGIKWTGWLIPPLTGNYTFYTRSDEESLFFLSTDADPRNLSGSPVCYLTRWVYSWPSSGTGMSRPIPLIGGNRYYFEYYHKEGGGDDLGQVGWDGPEYFGERPISGQYLSQYASDPEWAGTVQVGDIPVRYQVRGAGRDRYRISSESIQTAPGNSRDTVFRAPLDQTISLKGAPVTPPSTVWLRAIHYDFRADGSNNEFNSVTGYQYGIFKDMVQRRLTRFTAKDAGYFRRATIPKPSRNTSRNTPNRPCGLNKWFEDWQIDHRVYTYPRPDDCATTAYHASGDHWWNRKVYDSLEFVLDATQGPNTYVYSRLGNYDTGIPQTSWRGDLLEYFPLDRFGVDPAFASHNFGFCTELHTNFVHQSGLKVEFTGDDDVWVFINDSLVIDLGGVHAATSSFLNLDDLTHLVLGQTYNLDFFQCERRQNSSSSRIVTNITMVPPQGNPTGNWRRDYGSMD